MLGYIDVPSSYSQIIDMCEAIYMSYHYTVRYAYMCEAIYRSYHYTVRYAYMCEAI